MCSVLSRNDFYPMPLLTKKYIDDLTYQVIGAAIEVHQELGPGLLESVYETCMFYELELRGLNVKRQQRIPINYKGKELDAELRYDLLVEDCLVIELKAVNEMKPVFEAQALTYIKLLNLPKAVLINFNCTNIFHKGQQTLVNDIYRKLPQE